MTGEIPLGSLSNLGLYLYDNQLAGEIPTELGSLSNLQAVLSAEDRAALLYNATGGAGTNWLSDRPSG